MTEAEEPVPAPLLSSRQLVGLLAEPARRSTVAALVLGARSIEDIVARTGLDTRAVVDALDRLQRSGLVEPLGDGDHLLLEQAFAAAARAEAPDPAATDHPDEPPDRQRILDRAIRDGRLVRWPAKRSHRVVVLDHIAQRFEPGRRYTERQVNAMLAEVDGDVATVRRYLVDEALLDRADGEYWRMGGTFTVG